MSFKTIRLKWRTGLGCVVRYFVAWNRILIAYRHIQNTKVTNYINNYPIKRWSDLQPRWRIRVYWPTHTKSFYGLFISFLVEYLCFYFNFGGNCFSKIGLYVRIEKMIKHNFYNFLKYQTKRKKHERSW